MPDKAFLNNQLPALEEASPIRWPDPDRGMTMLVELDNAHRTNTILCRLAHDEVTHRIRETHHQADARGIFLEVQERGNEGKSAGGTFPKASGFTVLQEKASNRVVVEERDTAHRLHAEDEYRIGVTAPNAQACIVECRHA